jgi:hypothetical protein
MLERWLWMIDNAPRLLAEATRDGADIRKQLARRHRLNVWQTEMLWEQQQYANRARSRFPAIERWLWTDMSLQQATDWDSAQLTASLFPAGVPVVDGCCGAGANLVAFGLAGHAAVGIDSDPILCHLARANAAAHGLTLQALTAEIPRSLGRLDHVGLHLDPDRRASGSRSTQGDQFSPTLQECLTAGLRARSALIKVSPGTEVDRQVTAAWNRCWIGSGRECPVQLLVRGDIQWPHHARSLYEKLPGGSHGWRVAALVGYASRVSEPARLGQPGQPGQPGQADIACPPLIYAASDAECAAGVDCELTLTGRYLFEPHAALYAAGLAAVWCAEQAYSPLTASEGYYLGDQPLWTPWGQCFRIVEEVPWDDRQVRKWLRRHGIGALEVKKRLVQMDANPFQRRYSQPDGRPLTCLVTRIGRQTRAIMAERITAADLPAVAE